MPHAPVRRLLERMPQEDDFFVVEKGEPWKAASYALIKSSRWICAIRNTLVSNPTSSSVLGTVTVFAPETTTAEVLTM
jgi:hypothetical protein